MSEKPRRDDIHNPAGAKLIFQSDGNLVMYASTDDSRPVWASNTSESSDGLWSQGVCRAGVEHR